MSRSAHVASIGNNASCELLFRRHGDEVLHLKGDLNSDPHKS